VSELTYREGVIRALEEELERDDRVLLLGEDVGAAGGVFQATAGLFERFGPRRVRDTPISEQAIVGCALGASVTGLRPVAEIMFADFAGVCFDQIANQLAKYRYMTGGQTAVPVTIRMANGGGVGFAAQHSQAVENWFLNVPGLKICVPGTPADAYGLLKAAIRDDNPVLVFEHKQLYPSRGPVPDADGLVELGKAAVVRTGSDITVVATQLMRHRALDAAEVLAAYTGSPYFPGGLFEQTFSPGYLKFERGPSRPVTLEWATYYDAADQAGISRLYGGIHIAADDFAGRRLGSGIGKKAYALASRYFAGTARRR